MIKIRLIEKEVEKFIVIFYIIGTLGFVLPFTNNIFKILTPYALLINFFLLAYFHKKNRIKKDTFVFTSIFILGLIIEILGVQTKIIFGDYSYGNGLGLKVFDTPLIIGLNWLFLSYCTTSILNRVNTHSVIKIISSAALMVLYDLLLEQVAPKMNMWSWKNDIIPIQNYLVWFILALIFNSMLKIFRVHTKNPITLLIFSLQFTFLIVLFVYFSLNT